MYWSEYIDVTLDFQNGSWHATAKDLFTDLVRCGEGKTEEAAIHEAIFSLGIATSVG